MNKIGIVSLGCPKNQVDGERLLYEISLNNKYEIVDDPNESEIVIINTCGFIEDAKSESIDYILKYCNLKETSSIKKVIVSGCLAERYRDEIKKEIPEVDAVIGIGSNKDIILALDSVLNNQIYMSFKEKDKLQLSGKRILTNSPHYAYLKISEGCNHKCAFCAIPSIRGNLRSRTIEDIVEEAKELCEMGVKELIIVSQDTTMYGVDIYKKCELSRLLKELCKIDKVKWIRIMYCYPNEMTDVILETIASEEKIVKYIEIPIQHIHPDILHRMNRGKDAEKIKDVLYNIRKKVKDIAIRTSFIVGFPGETEEEFTQMHQFIKEFKFDRLGCFKYSKEEGTVGFNLENQIDEEEKDRRLELIMNEQMFIMDSLNYSKINKELDVIIDGYSYDEKCYIGRTSHDAPSIDGRVLFRTDNLDIGEIYRVRICDVDGYDLVAELI